MRKTISLLAVALLATTFAAGCGKFKNCDEAKEKGDCVAEKFEKDAFTGKCQWNAATNKCDKIATPPAPPAPPAPPQP